MDETYSMEVRTTKRRLFSGRQLTGLKESFQKNAYPAREDYEQLASSLGMKESSVKVRPPGSFFRQFAFLGHDTSVCLD